ncbi:MAG: DUF2059 domain-containing protein [Deltaproteobacteria bacterium]|nr:DUF2059 domain-containing protein [Deltaproteobacteria bacterium]
MLHRIATTLLFTTLFSVSIACGSCPKKTVESAASSQTPTPLPATHEESVALLVQTLKLDLIYERAIQIVLNEQMKANPQLSQIKDVMDEFLRKYMGWDAIRPEFFKMYMEAFTKAEIDEMIVFYQTPTGQKAARISPKLMEKGGEVGRLMVQEHLPELQQMIAEKMKRNANQ